jgi:hypothetical protein
MSSIVLHLPQSLDSTVQGTRPVAGGNLSQAADHPMLRNNVSGRRFRTTNQR